MNYSKQTKFSDRLSTAADAKAALIAKLKPKPTVTAAEPIDREAEREAKREEIRLARVVEKEKQREARAEREEAARLAAVATEQAVLEAKRAERKERKSNEKMDAQSRRAQRLAAYQGRGFSEGI
jgi:hypothetical protein